MLSNVAVLWAVILVLMYCVAVNAGQGISSYDVFTIPAHIIGDDSSLVGYSSVGVGGAVELSCIVKSNIFDYVFHDVGFSSSPKVEIGQTVLIAGIV